MFPTTQPMDAADSRPVDPPPTALTSLSPSLMQDLLRFDALAGPQRELLEVLAACVRHTQPLAITLGAPGRSLLVVSVFPLDRQVHCPVPLADLLAGELAALRVIEVMPARWRAPGSTDAQRIDRPECYTPLGPLLWAVALRGARDSLLPELAGQAAYRVSPGMTLGGLDVPGALIPAITRLRRQTSNLREITGWPGMGAERAMRLLNALYLQSGLIVSRTHPAATNEGWSGY
ncbi:MAG TPA: hypothetical protein PK306_18920 [Aquabacterium sp.]|nr:hypothetical protein [Aquabacterium sp.]